MNPIVIKMIANTTMMAVNSRMRTMMMPKMTYETSPIDVNELLRKTTTIIAHRHRATSEARTTMRMGRQGARRKRTPSTRDSATMFI